MVPFIPILVGPFFTDCVNAIGGKSIFSRGTVLEQP